MNNLSLIDSPFFGTSLTDARMREIFCARAFLRRCVETEVALRKFFTRFPGARLALPRSQIQYSHRPGTRGLVALPVKWWPLVG